MDLTNNTYFCVQRWMVTKLNLKSAERDVFAIIYGYSQDGDSNYHGSLKYLSEMTGYSRNTICTALKSLTDKDLLIKTENEVNNIKFCKYKANLYTVQKICTPVQNTCTNNINNNINSSSILSKDNIQTTASVGFEFGKPVEQKRTNSSEYQDALLLVESYSTNKELVSQLKTFISGVKEIKGKQHYRFYASTIKNYLDELSKECKTDNEKIEAVKLSIRYNYTTKLMKPNINDVGGISKNVLPLKGGTKYENEDKSFIEGVEF